MLILGIFENLKGVVITLFQTGESLSCFVDCGESFEGGVHGLCTNLIIFSQNHWDAADHKYWLTGVWYCQKCVRTHLCTNSGVVSLKFLVCSVVPTWLWTWSLVAMPRICCFFKAVQVIPNSASLRTMSQSILFLYEDFSQEWTRNRDPNLKGNLDKLGLWGWLFYSLRSLNFSEPQSLLICQMHIIRAALT